MIQIHDILLVYWRLRSVVILFLITLIMSGCTYIPTVHIQHINKSQNLLYISTTEGNIKTFDTNTYKWIDKIKIPDMESPSTTNMFNDGERIIVQAVDFGWKNPSVYVVKGKHEIDKIALLPHKLNGVDSEFFYAIEIKSIKEGNDVNNQGQWHIKGIKYDKQLKNPKEYHFKENPNLIVMDMWEDGEYYWFATINSPIERNINYPEGPIVLVAKSKITGEIELFEDTDRENWNEIHIVGDRDSIWLFKRSYSKQLAMSSTRGTEFSKVEKNFKYKKDFKIWFIPFANKKLPERSNYLWVFDIYVAPYGKKVYRIDKKNMEITLIHLPVEVMSKLGTHSNAIYLDENYLWINGDVHRKVFTPSGCCDPYLIRISKNDMSYELFLVKPTTGEAIKTIFGNFISWFILPFFKT